MDTLERDPWMILHSRSFVRYIWHWIFDYTLIVLVYLDCIYKYMALNGKTLVQVDVVCCYCCCWWWCYNATLFNRLSMANSNNQLIFIVPISSVPFLTLIKKYWHRSIRRSNNCTRNVRLRRRTMKGKIRLWPNVMVRSFAIRKCSPIWMGCANIIEADARLWMMNKFGNREKDSEIS